MRHLYEIKVGDLVRHTKPYQPGWPLGSTHRVISVNDTGQSFRTSLSDEDWYAAHFEIVKE